MKTLFIEAKYKDSISLSKEIIGQLPVIIGLVSSIQFIDSLSLLKKSIESLKNESINHKSLKNKNSRKIIKKALIGGQVLGCDASAAKKIESNVDAFLYVGDGAFHPLAVALATKKPVFQYNPLTKSFSKVKEAEIEAYNKRKKGALLKFLSSENIGVLMTTKSGQAYPMEKAKRLEKKYPQKKFYYFVADTIDYRQLENFPFIEAWVNTACPRIEEDISILNIKEIGK